jgi:hypothetical protein
MRKSKKWPLRVLVGLPDRVLVRFLAACVVILAGVPRAPSQNATLPKACAAEAGRMVACVKPSATDPAIRRFDTPHFILFNAQTGPDADLTPARDERGMNNCRANFFVSREPGAPAFRPKNSK